MRCLYALVAVCLLSCGGEDFGSGGDGGAGGTGGSAAGGTGGSAAGGTGGSAGGWGGTSGAGAGGAGSGGTTCREEALVLVADTCIYPEYESDALNCGSTINSGNAPVVSVGAVQDDASRVLLRFQLNNEQLSALSNGRAKRVRLDLHRAAAPGDCGGAGTCAARAGTLVAHPMTADWAEGATGSKDGAQWCFAGPNYTKPWSSPGAEGSAHSPQRSVAAVDDTQPIASVSIPAADFNGWVDPTTRELAILTKAESGLQFFFYAREAAVGHPSAALEICP